ncbi:hypothetical protein [Streptomyces sp. NPDC047869]|uniref:hypothetical protein n=1 Tax=Streptomyces sp. NPDC047869 TaxID=3154709 RepID=UPI0034529E6C
MSRPYRPPWFRGSSSCRDVVGPRRHGPRRLGLPLYRLWRQAALETQNKSRAWIAKSSAARGTMMATRATPPMELSAFREITEGGYRLYAGVFLAGCCDAALEETYDQLWLSWDQALAS